ncbi:hypothetical protein [Streptomyces sp. NBC_01244]|uniref:hypothetical protein n=1 Tax=Streptomyces sp. NBC_01244 TaxID=2903797 RepID=UPI002E16107A|nr:hypothetical protein OG247_07350 [Streptomyces sp. NBC_01244]
MCELRLPRQPTGGEAPHNGNTSLVLVAVVSAIVHAKEARTEEAWSDARGSRSGRWRCLQEIHRVGLIHWDLKPENVLLAEDRVRAS